MGTITKRGKIWYVDFYYKGKRIRQSLKTSSKKLAELKGKEIELQIAKEQLNLAPFRKITFESFAKRFLSWYKMQNSKKSYYDYANLFNNTLTPHFQNQYLSDINAEMVEKYKIKRAKEIRPASVNKSGRKRTSNDFHASETS